jgi:hypothetical protein
MRQNVSGYSVVDIQKMEPGGVKNDASGRSVASERKERKVLCRLLVIFHLDTLPFAW